MNSHFHPPSNALEQYGGKAALPTAKLQTRKLHVESNLEYTLKE
jgi:hypothetical protein